MLVAYTAAVLLISLAYLSVPLAVHLSVPLAFPADLSAYLLPSELTSQHPFPSQLTSAVPVHFPPSESDRLWCRRTDHAV